MTTYGNWCRLEDERGVHRPPRIQEGDLSKCKLRQVGARALASMALGKQKNFRNCAKKSVT